jgi:hypothetical protein
MHPRRRRQQGRNRTARLTTAAALGGRRHPAPRTILLAGLRIMTIGAAAIVKH